MGDSSIEVERALRVSRFAHGFAHGADPDRGRKRIESSIAGDPDWRAGMEAGRYAAEEDLLSWDESTLRVDLARRRDPDRYREIRPSMAVVDKLGKITRHPFEEPHDVPGQGTCWFCLRDRDDKVHRSAKQKAVKVPF